MTIKQLSIEELTRLAKKGAENAERDDQVDQERFALVGRAAHGVRVLGEILEAAIPVIDTANDSAALSRIISTTIKKADHDANKIFTTLGLVPDQVPDSVRSMWRGMLVQQLCGSIEQNIGSAMRMEADGYLQPIIEHMELAQSVSPVSYELNDLSYDLRMGMALAMASSQVLAAYESFSYYYQHAEEVSELVTSHLQDRVYDGTLADLRRRYQLTDNEASYIGNALMHRAGRLMASSWAKNVPETMDVVQGMSHEERQSVTAKGFPLDIVFDDFDNFYQGIAVSVVSAFEHTLKERSEPVQKKSNPMRMGN